MRNYGRPNSECSHADRSGRRKVFLEGEYWNATSDIPVDKGQLVQISAVEGLTSKSAA